MILCTLFTVFLPVLPIFIRRGISIINSAAVIPPPPQPGVGGPICEPTYIAKLLPWTALHDCHGLPFMIAMDCHAWFPWSVMQNCDQQSCMIITPQSAWWTWTAPTQLFFNIIFNGAFYRCQLQCSSKHIFCLTGPQVLQFTRDCFQVYTQHKIFCVLSKWDTCSSWNAYIQVSQVRILASTSVPIIKFIPYRDETDYSVVAFFKHLHMTMSCWVADSTWPSTL
jgi:hypothetical protein